MIDDFEVSEADLEADANEILDKIDTFQTDHSTQLSDFNKYAKLYRAQPTKTRSENQSNTFIPELFVETEALATAAHEMLFSDNSDALFFDVVGQDGGSDDRARAKVTKATIAKQIELSDLHAKSLPWFRTLVLQGNAPLDVPWVLAMRSYWDGLTRMQKSAFDCWDFQPFNLDSYSFDDSEESCEKQEWGARTQNVKSMAARSMARKGIWRHDAVEDALESGFKRNIYETERRRLGGFMDLGNGGKGFTYHEYYGPLESRKDDEMYWACVTSEGKFLREPEINPYNHGEKPWFMGKWFSNTGDPYAMGVGHINYRTQSELNDRRNFINDILFASLYNMWAVRSDSGLSFPNNKMKWSPHQILTGDGISEEFIRALRPDMSGLPAAINLQNLDIDKMRVNSGATTVLQGLATGGTATESTQVQSEATRRIKAMVRSNIASTFRKFLYRVHALNMQFLDQPMQASIIDERGYETWGQVSREDQITEPHIRMKLSVDLDFRPFKRKELIEFLNVMAQLAKSGMNHGGTLTADPVIEELAGLYGIDPQKFWKPEGLQQAQTQQAMQQPQTQAAAMQEMISQSPAAQQVMQTGQMVPQ